MHLLGLELCFYLLYLLCETILFLRKSTYLLLSFLLIGSIFLSKLVYFALPLLLYRSCSLLMSLLHNP